MTQLNQRKDAPQRKRDVDRVLKLEPKRIRMAYSEMPGLDSSIAMHLLVLEPERRL